MEMLSRKDQGSVLKIRGWLFDIYPAAGGVVVWIIDESGRSVRGYAPFSPSFFVHVDQSTRPQVEAVAKRLRCVVTEGWTEKKDLYSDKHLKVIKVVVPDILHFREIVRHFESQFPYYVFFNSDLLPVQTFMFERDIFPLALGDYSFDGNGKLIDIQLDDDITAVDYTLPPLTIMTLRPSFSEVAPKYRNNISLEAGYDGRIYSIEADSSEELITRINSHIDRCDPDVLITEYGDHTILPMLLTLSKEVKVPIHLNRDESVAYQHTREISYWSYGQVVHRAGSFELAGRWHLDAYNSFIMDESDLSGLLELARITRIPVQRQARESIGTGLSSIQLAWAYRHDVLIPAKKQEWEKFKSASQLLLADRGGLIYLPKMGYHEQVAELDFASMYPSLMVMHNISPETVNCQCCENDKVPELHYTLCEKRRGIIAETLDPVLKKRAAYKLRERKATAEAEKKEYHKRQTSLKWLLVTSFGYLGYKNARFGKIEAHESVNAFSREALLKAKIIAERNGYSVIHGIVDCLWLAKAGATENDYKKLGEEISKSVGVLISLEGIYKWILFPASRMDPEIPTANRYVGAYTNGEVKVRGIEVRRGDIPLFVRKMQGEILDLFATAGSVAELKKMIPAALDILSAHLENLKSGRVAPMELVIRHTISKDADEYEHNSAQAVVAKSMSEAGVALQPGETAEYIIVDHTGKKDSRKAVPFVFYRTEDGYDVEKYVDLAMKAVEVLLVPLGWTPPAKGVERKVIRKKKEEKIGELIQNV